MTILNKFMRKYIDYFKLKNKFKKKDKNKNKNENKNGNEVRVKN